MKNTNAIFDGLLVLEYRSGSNKALSLLVKRWHKKFCEQAYWYVKDSDIAQDIVQESWQTIIQKIHTLKDVNSFGSWARAIVYRKSLNRLKKQSKEVPLTLCKEEIENTETADSRIPLLRKAIATLPIQQQIVLKLFYTESHTLTEISTILNVSKGTVKSRLFYARENLKKIIK